MADQNIGFALHRVATLQPDVTAIVELKKFKGDHFQTKVFTYAELESLCDEYVRGFFDLGVKKGDRVAVLVPASAVLYALTFALYRLGALSSLWTLALASSVWGDARTKSNLITLLGVEGSSCSNDSWLGAKNAQSVYLGWSEVAGSGRTLKYLQSIGRRSLQGYAQNEGG